MRAQGYRTGLCGQGANVNGQLEQLTDDVMRAIEDRKGVDALILNVRGRSAVTDCFVLASGRNPRQLKAMAQAVVEVAHRHGLATRIEGLDAAEWLLIDLGDVVVHLFLPEVRETFQLERLWAEPAGGEGGDAA